MQLNPTDQPDSKSCILLFLLGNFGETAASAGQGYFLCLGLTRDELPG